MAAPPRLLELFCGIGGCAAAVHRQAEVVAAIDINRSALVVYQRNFPHPVQVRTLESLSAVELQSFAADVWWMSPPCQPYTVRGVRRDDEDPRAQALLSLLPKIADIRPRCIGMENVQGFVGSRCHQRLQTTLQQAGYQTRETILSPEMFGIPNRRERFFLVASLEQLRPWPTIVPRPQPLQSFLHSAAPSELWVPEELLVKYATAVHVVAEDDPQAVTHCFTSAYGRSPIRSGSYLRTHAGVRRFAPEEILRLLGFASDYHLPPDLSPKQAWPLVGNSLSVDCVRYALAAVLP